jgi:NADH-quinone oxidoreductase subunit N
VLLVVAAFFLKAAIIPFHAWAPDAYQGATVPVTAYMAAIVKAGVLLAAVRLFGEAGVPAALVAPIALLPLVSMAWGNLAAIRQSSFRRMIAYSSIAHAGYLFFAFLGAPEGRFEAVAFYVIAYGLMNLLAFAALPGGRDDAAADRLEALKGLFQRRPYAAITLGLAMLSLAGLPPFPGFVAKFLIFRNVIEAGHTGLAVAGLRGQLPRPVLLPAGAAVRLHERRRTGTRPPPRPACQRAVPAAGVAADLLPGLADRLAIGRASRQRAKRANRAS